MSLQNAFEQKLNAMSNGDKDDLLTQIALIIDNVKEVEGGYTKEQAFDRIVSVFNFEK